MYKVTLFPVNFQAGVDIGVKKNIVFRWQPPAGHDVSFTNITSNKRFASVARHVPTNNRSEVKCGGAGLVLCE